jgi:dipeptidyl-peptidase-4
VNNPSARPAVDEFEYRRALELWQPELMAAVRNITVALNWIGDSDRFWFRLEATTGHSYVIVDAATGRQSPAFDHALIARALGADAAALPIQHFDIIDDGRAIRAVTPSSTWTIDVAAGAAQAAAPANPAELAAASGRTLLIRDYNLWLREVDGRERVLTADGVALHAWGSMPDHDLMKVARSRAPLPMTPTGCYWAPDSRHLLAQRCDERHMEPYPYLESVPADGSPRPKVHLIRQQLAGEAAAAIREWFILDADSGARVPVQLPPDFGRLAIVAHANGGAYWAPDSASVYVLAATSNSDRVALLAIDRASGRSRILHEESVATFFDFNTLEYNKPNVRLVPARNEMLWYSQRSGYGHLYVIDLASGGIRRQLTGGDWAVYDIVHVNATTVFFSAGGREPGRHPYYRHLYRVDLDGSAINAGLALLTPEDADHGFPGEPTPLIAAALRVPAARRPMAPSGRYFVDCHSRVDRAPVTVIRDATGKLIAEVVKANIGALEAKGWRAPEIFSAKAADGVTDLYGVLIKPRNFDPARRWPLLERIYGGPQINAQPRNFAEGLSNGFVYGAYSLAELGFVVAILDGPGTPFRSKAFHDLTWDQADRWGIGHHRAALENAARTRPWLDLSCVGISGHSYGGYATAMALVQHGDFYKVGVSSAGMYDPMWAHQATPERHLGRPHFGGGRYTKESPAEVAENYRKFAPATYAGRLTGRLLLAFGDLDENIQPAALLQFVDALIRAGKSYDLIVMPGRSHGFGAEPYFQKRLWDYFIENVQGREPARHFRLPVEAGQRILL